MFDLGPHGGFVWSAWAIALAALGALLVASLMARARVRRELRRRGLDRRPRREGEGT